MRMDTDPAPLAGRRADLSFRDPDNAAWPLAAIALLLIAQASLIFTRSINWDEFYHFATLVDLADGSLRQVMQTFFLWPFAWIPSLSGNDVDHIILARIGMFICEWAVLGAIFVLARRFTDRTTAVLAVLSYLSAGYVLQHGFAFRADPMVTAVLMWSLAALTSPRKGMIVVGGMLAGLAVMLTMKAALYLPVFLCLAWWRLSKDRFTIRTAGEMALGAVAAAAVFGALFLLHSHLLAGTPVQGVQNAEGTATSAARHMFFLGLPNNRSMIVGFVFVALGLFALIVMAPFAIARMEAPLPRKIALAGLWLPFLTLFFYENTASYYYVFMLAPVCVACTASIDLVRRKAPAMLMTVALVSLVIPAFALENRTIIDRQRTTLDRAYALFDKPVAYFDHADMLARFDKQNGFLTPWGLHGYRDAGRPIYREAMERRTVPLLLANWFTIQDALAGVDDIFLPEDNRALRNNYLRFEGPIWLAGKEVTNPMPEEEEFLVPGPYTVHGAPVTIDGEKHQTGSIVEIARGNHRVSADTGPARLVWGRNLKPSGDDALQGSQWVRF